MLYSRLGFKKIKMRVVYLAGLLWKSEWKRIRTGIFRAVIVILSKKKVYGKSVNKYSDGYSKNDQGFFFFKP